MLLALGGALWLFVSGLSSKMDDFERIVASSGLSIALAVLAGCVSLFVGFRYVDLTTVCLLVALFVLFLAKHGLQKPKLKLEMRKRHLVPISLCAIQLVLLALYLHAFPFFPNNDAMDIVWHISLTDAVLRGQIVAPFTELGSHALFAYVYSLVGGVLLESVRITVGAVDALSVLVAYCMFSRLFPQYECAEYATIAFSLLMPAELIYYTGIGAYANIVGDFFVLLSLLLFLTALNHVAVSSTVTLIVVQGLSLVSHISVLIFAGLMVRYSFILGHFGYRMRGSWLASVGFLAIPLLAVVISPNIVAHELGYISTLNYVGVQSDPVLALTTWFANYAFLAGALSFALVLIALMAAIVERRHYWASLLATWFILLFLSIFFGSNGSRFILLSLVPGAGLVGLLLFRIQGYIRTLAERVTSVKYSVKTLSTVIMICLLLIMTATGPLTRIGSEIYIAEGSARQKQLLVYESMAWLGSNASSSAVVVSVDLQKDYRYLPTLFNRTYVGDTFSCLYYQTHFDCLDNQSSATLLKLAPVIHFNYIAISTNFAGIQDYSHCQGLRTVFSNSQVVIFLVTDTSCDVAVT